MNAKNMARSTETRLLQPWKAFVGVLLCGACALIAYHRTEFLWACLMSVLAGAWLEDWMHRCRDKYYPQRSTVNE
jgi:hypothetical protein